MLTLLLLLLWLLLLVVVLLLLRVVAAAVAIAQIHQDEASAPDAWQRKTVCGEVDSIDQTLFGMCLSSYGVEKAHRRYVVACVVFSHAKHTSMAAHTYIAA